jgi:hypothetical protein
MAAPRHNTLRGTLARGESSTPARARGPLPPAEPVDDPTRPRARVDYALQRRAALRDLHTGGALTSNYCEADPYLLRAARHHGEPSGDRCPACKREDLVHLSYVYGDALGPYAGRIRTAEELVAMSSQYGEFTVYVVEVCQRCEWNFMIRRYALGDGVPRRPPTD